MVSIRKTKKRTTQEKTWKKVFSFFNKTNDAAIQIDNIIIYWDSLTEYENKVVTVRNYDGRNYTEEKKSYDKAKKECYKMV